MKYYIIAGEASGDLHGSNLMKALFEVDQEAQIRFWGGDLMASVGGTLVKHYKQTAVMGIFDVISKLGPIIRNLQFCKKDIIEYKPDVIILIDYPGFNFKIAKFAKKHSLRVFYYIPPTVWGWKEWRIKSLTKYVDRIFIIFPFEVNYYKKKGIKVFYFGNPLLDSIAGHRCNFESFEEFTKRCNLDQKPIITLLPGSRVSEIKHLLPVFSKLESEFPDYQLIVAGAPSIDEKIYLPYISGTTIKLLFGETYSLLKHSRAAALCSGTASLEAAILDTPQVVCYRAKPISVAIIRPFVKVKYISLVNLIFNQPVVKELIQEDCTVENLADELRKILSEKESIKIRNKYAKLRKILGDASSSRRIAESMLNEIQSLSDENLYYKYYKSPIGMLKLIADEDSLVAIRYIREDTEEKYHEKSNPKGNSILENAARQLEEYFAEKRKVFDIPLKPTGTPFQQKVWKELSNIPYGQVKTYGEIASIVETKDASRAVGNACRLNPLPIVIPCHRVIGANNRLTGFNMGIDKKLFLLTLEKAYESSEVNLFNSNSNFNSNRIDNDN
ncbi:MAG: lipid-A-disaccharide synthase [Rikenellaceae bacterium]|mgnify:FL=1|jgi:lipid-A-disaccharide synthase